MFNNRVDELDLSFRATMSIFGRPVSVLSPGRVGTQVAQVKPTTFHFYCFANQYIVSVGDIAGKQYVVLDDDGYLGIGKRAEHFGIFDLENSSPLSRNHPQGEVDIYLYSSKTERVMQFEGDNAFDDQETLYNFLIAGRKVRRENLSGEVSYMVPDGRGAWMRYPANKPFTPKPVPIVLNIQ
ncbi:hypothetical protein [Pseudomonas grandcourensis]|uniref:hypothetical protein n=1 Tax=Pseudomonas grandcourensis TaxID=3136736 RepID=UPI0032656796